MKSRLLIIIAFFVVYATYAELEVYGHGVGSRLSTGFYIIEDETISKTAVPVGESFFINGTITSIVERDIQGQMDVKFDYTSNDSWFVNLLKSNFSCLTQDMCTKPIHVAYGQNYWYLDIKPKPDAYVLKGNDMIPYSIEMIALKSGTYHIHTDPDADIIESFRHIGPGQTIMVEGSQDITKGELFEFYIPYSTSFVLIIIGMGCGTVFAYRRRQRKRK